MKASELAETSYYNIQVNDKKQHFYQSLNQFGFIAYQSTNASNKSLCHITGVTSNIKIVLHV